MMDMNDTPIAKYEDGQTLLGPSLDPKYLSVMQFTVHEFDNSGSAYDACQCDTRISTGDILIIRDEGVVGVADAWPVSVTKNMGKLHGIVQHDGTSMIVSAKSWSEASYGCAEDKTRLFCGFILARKVATDLGFAVAEHEMERVYPPKPPRAWDGY